jgi:hypothetical protein
MSENIKQNAKQTEKKRGRFISRKPKKRLSHAKNKNLPVEQVLHLQRTIGNRALNRLIRSGTIQAKLSVGKPDSIYEKEADSVADKVMSMPDKSPVQRGSKCPKCPERKEIQSKSLAEQITPLIRRQADEEEKAQTKPLIQRQAEDEEKSAQTKLLQRQEGEEEKEAQTKLQRQAEEEEKPAQTKLLQRQEGEEEKEAQTKIQRQADEEEKSAQTKLLQRQEGEEEKEAQPKLQRQAEEEEKQAQPKAAQEGTPEVTSNIESNINELKGGGQPLSESTRTFFEPRFGADFGQVRIHNNTKAANTAQSINAKAFTTGKDIVFNSGQYSPGTSSGKRLLAHELTHVVQQTIRRNSGSRRIYGGIRIQNRASRKIIQRAWPIALLYAAPLIVTSGGVIARIIIRTIATRPNLVRPVATALIRWMSNAWARNPRIAARVFEEILKRFNIMMLTANRAIGRYSRLGDQLRVERWERFSRSLNDIIGSFIRTERHLQIRNR